MWSINSRSGMEGRRHEHEGAISAAYYVDAGTSSECAGGQLQFYAEATKPSPTHAVTPRDGLLIMFPSRLHHSVSRYSSDYPRIVISANLPYLPSRQASGPPDELGTAHVRPPVTKSQLE